MQQALGRDWQCMTEAPEAVLEYDPLQHGVDRTILDCALRRCWYVAVVFGLGISKWNSVSHSNKCIWIISRHWFHSGSCYANAQNEKTTTEGKHVKVTCTNHGSVYNNQFHTVVLLNEPRPVLIWKNSATVSLQVCREWIADSWWTQTRSEQKLACSSQLCLSRCVGHLGWKTDNVGNVPPLTVFDSFGGAWYKWLRDSLCGPTLRDEWRCYHPLPAIWNPFYGLQ